MWTPTGYLISCPALLIIIFKGKTQILIDYFGQHKYGLANTLQIIVPNNEQLFVDYASAGKFEVDAHNWLLYFAKVVVHHFKYWTENMLFQK